MQNKLIVLLLFFTSVLLANDPGSEKDSVSTYKISDIIITANKVSTPSIEVASSVSVITHKEIEQQNQPYLADILRSEVGLSIAQQGGFGKISRVFIRGANPHHTLFLVDGVEVNNPSSINNAYDLSALQSDNIERIEILRGPQSTLYGSDAMAGVISVFTNKGEGKPKFNFYGETGSFNTFKENGSLSGSISRFNYALSFSNLSSDGISAASKEYGNTEKDFNKVTSLYTKAGVKVLNNLNLDFLYSYAKSKAGLDQNDKLGDDPNFEYWQEDASFKTSANLNLFDNLWQQSLNASYMRTINKTTDDVDEKHPFLSSVNYFNGERLKLEWQNDFKYLADHSVLFGIDAEREKGYSSYISNSEWGASTSGFPPSSSVTTGFYIQSQNKFLDLLYSNIGIRYDHNKTGYDENAAGNFKDAIASQVTFRIAETYFIDNTSTKVKGSYGTGFKTPSLYYLLEPIYGNRDLKPEKSNGWDVGFEQFLFNTNYVLGITYFYNDFTNLIGYDANYKTVNIDKAETKGLEFFVRISDIKNLVINANYTLSSNKDKSVNKEDSGKDLIRRPNEKGSIDINYNLYDANLNLETVFTGKREDKEYLPDYTSRRVQLKSYTLMNISVSYTFFQHIKLFGRLDNILDQKYEEVLFYGTPGVNGSIGIGINL